MNHTWAKKITAALGTYKYVLLVALIGAVLLVWPSSNRETPVLETLPESSSTGGLFEREELETRLEQALSQVEGAGEVTVVLSWKDGPRQIVAQDGSTRNEERETSTVLVAKGSGTEEALKIQELAPTYQGALIVASGADRPEVRLALTEAVSVLTGLGADRIAVCTRSAP